jgi:hypothetical protein
MATAIQPYRSAVIFGLPGNVWLFTRSAAIRNACDDESCWGSPAHAVRSSMLNKSVKVDKMSISFDSGLGDHVRDAARRAGTGLSSWLAGAAAARLRAEALEKFLDTWKKKHGTLTAVFEGIDACRSAST